jgi:hypothetical protein
MPPLIGIFQPRLDPLWGMLGRTAMHGRQRGGLLRPRRRRLARAGPLAIGKAEGGWTGGRSGEGLARRGRWRGCAWVAEAGAGQCCPRWWTQHACHEMAPPDPMRADLRTRAQPPSPKMPMTPHSVTVDRRSDPPIDCNRMCWPCLQPWGFGQVLGQPAHAPRLLALRQKRAGPHRKRGAVAMAGGLATGASARQGEEGLPTPTRSCVIIALTAPEEAVRQRWWAIVQGSRGNTPAVRASGIARAEKMSGEAPEPLELGVWV